MKTPTELELKHLYDPAKAHDYYERHKHLKGRHKGNAQPPPTNRRARGQKNARAEQKAKLQANVTNLELKLQKLEQLIQKKEAILLKDNKLNAKKAKKPKTKAELAAAAKKYRQSHKQQLKNKAKLAASKKGGHSKHGSGKNQQPDSQKSIAQLKALATKVKGQLAVAKQKLAAL